MSGCLKPLVRSLGSGSNIAFHICTVGESLLQQGFGILGQSDAHANSNISVGGQCHNGLGHALQVQLCIMGSDLAVAVQVRLVRVGDRGSLAHSIVQQRLGIILIGIPIAVVVTEVSSVSLDFLAVHSEGNVGSQLHQLQSGIGLAILTGKVALGVHITAQDILLLLISQVVQGVVEGIHTVGVVLHLRLHLTVTLAAHCHIRGSCHNIGHVGRSGTLLNHGIGQVVVGAVLHGSRGGHQQTLNQHAGRDIQLTHRLILPDVLRQKSHQTCGMRRSHGGAAHLHILVGLSGSAINRVDVAAGGSSLRLQGQRTGNAPGAEGTHAKILRVDHTRGNIVGNGQGPSVNTLAHCSASFANGIRVPLGDGHTGNGGGAVGQVHAEGPGGVIVDYAGGSVGISRIIQLDREVDLASGHKNHLASHIQAIIFPSSSNAV